MSNDPFTNISEKWKKGWQKIQADFNQFFGISSKTPENGTSLEDESQEISESLNLEHEINQKSTTPSNWQVKWDNFTEKIHSTFQQWESDIDIYTKQNQDKIQSRNEAWKQKWQENNHRIKQFFHQQQLQFTQNLTEMKKNIITKNTINKKNHQKTMEALSDSWHSILNQQKKEFKRFQRMQSRLWWRNYCNFIIWILSMILTLAGIVWILKHFQVF